MMSKNKFELLEDGLTIKGICPTGEEFYFDADDFDKIKSFTWYISGKDKLKTCINTYGKPLYKFVLSAPSGYEIDHVDRNRLNNRKSNLRICTHQQNQFNQDLQSNNSSGVIGVRFYKARNKYVARIKFCGRDIHLGYYENIKNAMQARNEAARLLFGSFAVLSEVDEADESIKSYVKQKCNNVCKKYNLSVKGKLKEQLFLGGGDAYVKSSINLP